MTVRVRPRRLDPWLLAGARLLCAGSISPCRIPGIGLPYAPHIGREYGYREVLPGGKPEPCQVRGLRPTG